ncbi:hypothetical protein ACIBKY_03640 [Nonomuraea sp. NPDC050394]|uniref:effector-associated constant component EACC1 n=1 Tax=Nonomuraea sp. NPDC050394 TaxID=3364363 RepID=UPI0037B513AA
MGDESTKQTTHHGNGIIVSGGNVAIHVVDLLAAVGGPAGIATILVTWLRHRKSRATLKVTSKDGTVVEFDVQGAKDPTALAKEVAWHVQVAQTLQASADDDAARAELVSKAVTAMLRPDYSAELAPRIGEELMAVMVASASPEQLRIILDLANARFEAREAAITKAAEPK